jgi:hypothetical protein
MRGRPGTELDTVVARLVAELSIEIANATRTSWTGESETPGPSIRFVPQRRLFDALNASRPPGWLQIQHEIERGSPDVHGDEDPGIVRRIAARLAH